MLTVAKIVDCQRQRQQRQRQQRHQQQQQLVPCVP